MNWKKCQLLPTTGTCVLQAARDVSSLLCPMLWSQGRAPLPFARGQIGDIWRVIPKLLSHCCTHKWHCFRGISLAQMPHPRWSTLLVYHGAAQPTTTGPLAPPHHPQPHWAACWTSFIKEYSPPAGKPILPENIASSQPCVPAMGRNAGELQKASKN